MYSYSAADAQRRTQEAPKGSRMTAGDPDHRGEFSRDRARVLHSAALRRLADKTQVVGPRDGDTPRTRLTHSLEVAQISRGIGEGLGLDPDLSELAGLTHDIGHPPYGHNGERALNELASQCGGFEGNAQTLRILTRLEPKIVDAQGQSFGLNLTRAALDAACKYPRVAGSAKKYGAYAEDAEILEWVRAGRAAGDGRASMEAQAMDWADDIAYSVHDVEDAIVSGRVNLNVLWDLVELAALAEKGVQAYGGDANQLIEAAGYLRQLEVVGAAAAFDGSLRSLVAMKAMTSELVGRYVGATIAETRKAQDGPLGREHGELIIPPEALAEVTLLKTIAVLYVMEDPGHLARQDRQRERMYTVYEYLNAMAPEALDPVFAQWWREADSDAAKQRVIIDQMASMTESRLEYTARLAADISGFLS